MLPFTHHRPPASRTAGFSLIEIMVGMVIGMLGIIIMMQVFSLFEGQKRTTGGGSEAQNNGAIALFGLVRDIRQAGYGIDAYNLAGCDLTLRAGVTISNALTPVTINHPAIPPGDSNTDTLLVIYGNSGTSPEGISISSQPSTNIYQVGAPTNFFAANDWVIAEPQSRPATCSMTLDQVQSSASTGSPATANITVTTGTSGVSQGMLYDLGPSPKILAYAVRSGNLTVCDYMVKNCGDTTPSVVSDPAVWVPVANNIVSLQAQYGHDTLTPPTPPAGQTSYIVDTYDKATPTNACGWVRTPAIRVALVARNAHYEKNGGTAAAPLFATSSYPTWAGGQSINLGPNPNSATDQSWKHYRYKVFQTTIAIRDTAWLGVQSGC